MYEYTTEVFSVGLEGLAPVDTDRLGAMAAEGWEPSLMTPVHNGFATLVLFRREGGGKAAAGRLVPSAGRAAAGRAGTGRAGAAAGRAGSGAAKAAGRTGTGAGRAGTGAAKAAAGGRVRRARS